MDIIVTHTNADFDGLAGMVAAQKLYPKSRLVLPGSPEKSVRLFLSLCKDMIQFDTDSECDVETPQRIIVVDTRHASRLGRIARLLPKARQIILYDHHPRTQADIRGTQDIYKKVGATATIMAGELKRQKKRLKPLEATLMALGIYEETDSLSNRSTTPEDLDAVSFLLSHGANLGVVSSCLKRELSGGELSFLTTLLHRTESHIINGVNVGVAFAESPGYFGELSTVTQRLLELENFGAVFVFVKILNKIQLVARSRLRDVNINTIVRHFGGGGHPYAASAVIKDADLYSAKKKLFKLLKLYIKERVFARDIMSHRLHTASPDTKVWEAEEMLKRYHIHGMPVMDGGKIIGIISAGDLQKARRHGFAHSRLKGYMSRSPITITPQTPLYEIRRILFEKGIGRLPVLKGRKLAGMVTRTDIFKKMYEGVFRTQTPAARRRPIVRIGSRMKRRLPPRIFKIIRLIGREADSRGIPAFVVGGFVRDLFLEARNWDIDIVVEKEGLSFAKIIADKLSGSLVVHRKFGTATVVIKLQGAPFKIDIATARTELYESPAALPTVKFATIRDDLYRRDFTINAMAAGINRKNFGRLIDFYGGQADLAARRIRVLHDLSFVDDPTRIFRAVRFEQRYRFRIEEHTEELIRSALRLEMIDHTQKQRLRDELILILKEARPLEAILRMRQLHELRFIHRRLRLTKETLRLFGEVGRLTRWYAVLRPRKRALDTWLIYLMALLDPLTRRQTRQICDLFVFTKGDRLRLLSSKKDLPRVLKALSRKNITPGRCYDLLHPLSYEAILFALLKARTGAARALIRRYLADYSGVTLHVKGQDLKALGLAPGPLYSRILRRALHAKLAGALATKKEEAAFVRRLIR